MNKATLIKCIYISLALCLALSMLPGCSGSEVLSPEPSALDLDTTPPQCPGLTNVTVSAGPSLSVTWGQGTDELSQASKLTYSIYMKPNSGSYDLLSPTKIVIGATTTLISNGVQLGETYTLFVTCKDEAGNVSPTGPTNEISVTVNDATPPSTITDLSVTNPQFTSLLLTWSPADDGAGGTTSSQMRYRIFVSTTSPVSTSGSPLATLTGATSYTHTGLIPNTTYYYKVVARDIANNDSNDSNEASNSTLVDSVAPAFSPDSGISVSNVTTSSLELNWNTASDNVTAVGSLTYNVYRCSGSTTCDPFAQSVLTTTSPGVTTYTDSGLAASTVYVYGVRARDASSNLSTNTDKVVSSTNYSPTGSFFVYPDTTEVEIRMGKAVAVANVVGNSYPDLILGAPNASEPGSSYINTGCIFIFAGTGVGQFSTEPTQLICQPNATANGGNNRNFGYAIASGDIDGNGTADLVVTSPQQNKMFLFRSTLSGGNLSIGANPTTITYVTSNNTFGYGVCLGNSDNSGALDIFVSAPYDNCDVACGGRTGTGNILVYTNTSSGGTFSIPSLGFKISPTQNFVTAGYTIANNENVARSCAYGKFDPAAPTDDILVIGSGQVAFDGTTNLDGAVSFYRKTSANTYVFQNVFPSTTPAVRNGEWGESLATVQVDSGVHELFIGAPNNSDAGTRSGVATGYTISKAGAVFNLVDIGQAYTGGAETTENGTGSGIAAADIFGHGDGKQDLVVGAYLDDNTTISGATNINLGQAYVYRNNSGVITTAVQQTNFDVTDFNAQTNINFGRSVCHGDVNNDGRKDVIIGSPSIRFNPNTLTYATNSGAVYIYYGKATGEIDFENPSQTIYNPGNIGDSYFGMSCVVMDQNNDGRNDLLVGAPYRDIGSADRGVIYVYESPGLNADLPTSASTTISSPVSAANVYFGYSLAKGDLDNNGFDDLIVGSPLYDSWGTDTGRVWIIWATNTTGVLNASNFTTIDPPNGNAGTANNPHLVNNQPTNNTSYFGYEVESFATVPGSTGKDLIVCSPYMEVAAGYYDASVGALNNQGTCFIFEGRVNGGLGSSYQVMTYPRNEIRYPYAFNGWAGGDQYFGTGMTTGDWNNDGTEDLVVCAFRQRNLNTSIANAGGCFAFLGQVGGGFQTYTSYRSNASGTRSVPVADDAFYNPNTEAGVTNFGIDVGLVDINNNGSPDLLVCENAADNTNGPSNLGYQSGRVLIMRGGY